MAGIQINLVNDKDAEIKNMVKALIACEDGNNPYRERSESDVCKMIIREPLRSEYEKYCKKTKKVKP